MPNKTVIHSSEQVMALAYHDCDPSPLSAQTLLGNRRIALLASLEQDASIKQAADAVQLSYAATLAELDAMNNLTSKPLLIHALGTAQDGKAYLTEHGRRTVQLYSLLHTAQQEFQQRIAAQFPDFGQLGNLLQALSLKSSARNQLRGRIIDILPGPVNADITLDLGGGFELYVNMTHDTLLELGLDIGRTATALIKPSFVLLAIDEQVRISARNRLGGIVSHITRGVVNCEIKLQLTGGRSLVASITRDALEELDLGEGSECWAFIKASHVLLAVQDWCPARSWPV